MTARVQAEIKTWNHQHTSVKCYCCHTNLVGASDNTTQKHETLPRFLHLSYINTPRSIFGLQRLSRIAGFDIMALYMGPSGSSPVSISSRLGCWSPSNHSHCKINPLQCSVNHKNSHYKKKTVIISLRYKNHVSFEVHTMVNIKIMIIWDVRYRSINWKCKNMINL